MSSPIPIVLSFVFGALFLVLVLVIVLCSCLGKLRVGNTPKPNTNCTKVAIAKNAIGALSCTGTRASIPPPRGAAFEQGTHFQRGHWKPQQNLQHQPHQVNRLLSLLEEGLQAQRQHPVEFCQLDVASLQQGDSPPSYLECISSSSITSPEQQGQGA